MDDSVLAITGGTGNYATDSGQMALHARNDQDSEFVFTYELASKIIESAAIEWDSAVRVPFERHTTAPINISLALISLILGPVINFDSSA